MPTLLRVSLPSDFRVERHVAKALQLRRLGRQCTCTPGHKDNITKIHLFESLEAPLPPPHPHHHRHNNVHAEPALKRGTRYPRSCDDRNRIFDHMCPARFRRRRKSAVSAVSGPVKKTIASAARQPFFVPPKLRTSTPQRHVISAGEHPNPSNAFANRAYDMTAWFPECEQRLNPFLVTGTLLFRLRQVRQAGRAWRVLAMVGTERSEGGQCERRGRTGKPLGLRGVGVVTHPVHM
jgi:hypothetical protein